MEALTACSTAEKNGFAVETVSRALDEDELIARIAGVELLGIRSKTSVTDAVLAAAPEEGQRHVLKAHAGRQLAREDASNQLATF